MQPLIVYTAIIGGFNDRLRPAPTARDPQNRPVKYVCFTDSFSFNFTDPPSPDGAPKWELRLPRWEHLEVPRRTARWHKLLAHRALGGDSPEFSLWLDGSHQLKVNPWELVDRYLAADKSEVATFKHCQRDCVYEEAKACVALHKDDTAAIVRQMDRYAREGVPHHAGLYETSVFLRRHTLATAAFNEAWWRELSGGSLRDQLSVNYVARECKVDVKHIAGTRYQSPFFVFHKH